MPTTKTIRACAFDTLAAIATAAAAVLIAAPTHAAVVQTGPVSAVFMDEMSFDPSRTLSFDTSLGTLNTATLSFTGTVSVSANAFWTNPAPYPSALGATVSVLYTGGARPASATASLGTVSAAATVTEGLPYPRIVAQGSEARAFDLVISAADYGTGSVGLDFSFDRGLLAPSSTTGVGFSGTVTAAFDYVPLAGSGVGTAGGNTLPGGNPTGVPEPASLALLGFGLAGLVMARRRIA